ncbi:MAG: oligosaccharide repeat unit polymerase [Candidatus Omnitrophica bacterium]|nr:oligosaccharide repeat unit polymerase [Candidatus Omnitrophota bacterium]
MVKKGKNIVIAEFFIIGLMAILVYNLFSQGVSWKIVQSAAALIFLGILLSLVFEARQRRMCIVNAKTMILTGVLAWILLDPLTLKEGIEKFSPESISKAFVMILLFMLMVYLGYIIEWPAYFEKIFKKLDYKYSFSRGKLFKFTAIFLFLGLLPILIWGGGAKNIIYNLTHAGRFGTAWGRGAYGGWTDWIKTGLSLFGIIGIQLTWFYSIFVKKKITLILLALVNILIIFNTGTRTSLGAVLLPLFLLYYLHAYNNRRKSRYVIFILFYLLLIVFQIQLIVRSSSHGTRVEDIVRESISKVSGKAPTEFQRDNQFYEIVRIGEYVPSTLPYSGELLIFRPLYHFVPRAIWKGKPGGITKNYENLVLGEGMSLTLAVSMIGEFYICNGWLGICAIGILIGFLAKQFDSLIEMSRRSPAILLVYSYGLTFLFISIRSYQIVYEGWYAFIFIYFMLKWIRVKKPTTQYEHT